MKRVTGIGGVFFKSRDPAALSAWYRQHLGLDVTDWGGAIFRWGGPESDGGVTVWSPFAQDTDYMAPGTASFMINFRVADLDALLSALKAEGCEMMEETSESEQGKFGWGGRSRGQQDRALATAPGLLAFSSHDAAPFDGGTWRLVPPRADYNPGCIFHLIASITTAPSASCPIPHDHR